MAVESELNASVIHHNSPIMSTTTDVTQTTTTTSTTTANTSSSAMTVTTSAISLPAFWPNRAELWFATAEARFELAHPKITQEQTKFNHVLTVLSAEVADEVADLITKPDAQQPYTALKQAVINRTTLSESQKLKQLLSGEELGSRKPSQLLRHMRLLAQNAGLTGDAVLKELFLQQLPTSVRPILVSLNQVALDQVAEIADRVVENIPSVAAVQANATKCVAETPQAAPPSDPVTKLADKLDAILERLEKLERSRASHRRSQSRRRDGRSHSRAKTPDASRVCWYHRKFGAQATRCTTPCGYELEKNDLGKQE